MQTGDRIVNNGLVNSFTGRDCRHYRLQPSCDSLRYTETVKIENTLYTYRAGKMT